MRVLSTIVGAVALSIVVAGCGSKRGDPTADVEQALKAAHLSDVHVQWDNDSLITHLRGTVNSAGDRSHAEEIATSVIGTSGQILNELSVKDLDEHTADNLDGQIRSALKKMIDDDPVLRDRHIEFDVTNGVVTAKGKVRTVAEKTRVTDIVRATPGVKDMANALALFQ